MLCPAFQVVDPPKVKMQNNRIKCDGGYGVTIGRKQYTSMETKPLVAEAAQKEDSGDAPVAPIKSKGTVWISKLLVAGLPVMKIYFYRSGCLAEAWDWNE